jgi:hypothetical protein
MPLVLRHNDYHPMTRGKRGMIAFLACVQRLEGRGMVPAHSIHVIRSVPSTVAGKPSVRAPLAET